MCRPPGNRDPLEEEIEMCCKYLRKQIEIIKPRLLVLLGKTAVKGLCPNFAKDSVEKLRSMTKSLGLVTYVEIPVMVTYHPSALLRAAWRRVGAKEDFEFLREKYKEFTLISKQDL
jgi:DNA polymerase